MSSPRGDGNVRAKLTAAIAADVVADTLSRNIVSAQRELQLSTIATTWPSATTSSSLTRIDLSFPAVVEATGISIFIASTNAISSPSPTLAPVSTGSAHTRPATSVTILISGIPFSRDRLTDYVVLVNGFLLWPQIA